MGRRRLLRDDEDPWRCIGVQWTAKGERTKVVWAYEEISLPAPRGWGAREVLTDRKVPRVRGRFRLHGGRVYYLAPSGLVEGAGPGD